MKKYAFKLQTVLGMREKVLEEKQLEMAKIVDFLNQQITKLENLKSKKETTRVSLENIYEQDEALDIFGITNYKNFLGKITNDIKNQEATIENIKNVLQMKQKEVNEAYKEVKVLEKLREKQEKQFYQHIEYVQAQEIDDIASTRYKRA